MFEKSGYFLTDPIRSFDISRDSHRFLMVNDEEVKPQPATEMILVQNWFEELKRLVPKGSNSSTSGRMLTLVFLRLVMRGRG
ncbi:MAG: hypothetical protein PVI66_17280 [Candidatus Aminicenantes bacterium]